MSDHDRRVARLQARDALFRSAFEHTAIGMAVVSPEGRALEVNPALAAMLGYSREEMLQRSWEGVTHPDDCAATRDAAEAVVRGEAPTYQIEKRYLHKDGHVLWGSMCGAPVRAADGTVVCFVVQVQDITTRKLAEKALQRTLADLRAREEQLRLMALHQVAIREEERKRLGVDLHDGVCQELVGIGILIEAALQRVSPGPERTGLERAQDYLARVGEHLRKLARDLRPLQLADLGLAESLRALAAGMARDATRITTRFTTSVPRLGEDTEMAVYRVAQEALTNAVRHASARTITLTLEVRDGRLRLEVRDDGVGFERARPPVRTLGLVTMEERATALGGSLTTRSARGTGTVVRLDCPARSVTPQSAA